MSDSPRDALWPDLGAPLPIDDEPTATREGDEQDAPASPPAQHEVARAGTPLLPGLDQVPEKPADDRRPSWTA